MNSFEQMEAVIAQRRAEPQEGSYTCYLFEKGIDKVLKKVMMNECGVTMEDVCKEMDIRAQKIGNLKKFHVSDHNT